MNDAELDPKQHRKKLKHFNTPGQAHYLTFSCFRRQPFLSGDRSRRWLIDAINLARSKHQFHLWAYVIMPEHAHLILLPTRERYDISQMLATLKMSVTRKALAFVKAQAPDFLARMADPQPNGKISYRFWQRGGGYDRNLFTNIEIWEKIQYLHKNPVKRNLCAKSDDWIWSSAADYLGTRTGPVKLDLDSLPKYL